MIFIIMVTLITLILCLIFADDDRMFASIFMPIIFAIFAGMLWGVISAIYYPTPPRVVDSNLKIVSLRDYDDDQGHFFLGSGQVSGVPSYIFYTNSKPGTYNQGHVSADSTTIVEDSSVETASLITIIDKSEFSIWGLWDMDGRPHPSYELHVPQGTIYKQFDVK